MGCVYKYTHYVYVCVYICVYVCMCIYMCMYVHTCIYVCIYVLCACVYMCVCIYVCVYTHIYEFNFQMSKQDNQFPCSKDLDAFICVGLQQDFSGVFISLPL